MIKQINTAVKFEKRSLFLVYKIAKTTIEYSK